MTAQPKSARSRKTLLAPMFAVALLAAAAPASATDVAGAHFTLTIADNWTAVPFGSDSMKMVMESEVGATGFFTANNNNSATPEQFMAAMENIYGSGEGLVKENSGPKEIGGKNFHTSEWKDTASDGNPNTRVRFYAIAQGNVAFIAWMGYDNVEAPNAVSEFEAALATLKLSGSSSIRRYAGMPRATRMVDPRDLLGRSVRTNAARMPVMPWYSRLR
jgi:hypothetical protein